MEGCCFQTVGLTHCMLWCCCLVASLFELLSFHCVNYSEGYNMQIQSFQQDSTFEKSLVI